MNGLTTIHLTSQKSDSPDPDPRPLVLWLGHTINSQLEGRLNKPIIDVWNTPGLEAY